MIGAVIWKVILLIIGVTITARIVSRYVLSPFRQTMNTIKGVPATAKEKITLPGTSTTEFKELNSFLQKNDG